MNAPASLAAPRQRFYAGLWRENAALVTMLGLCPLMAVSTSAINGLALGLATLVALIVAMPLLAALRALLDRELRIPLFVIVIGGAVSLVDLLTAAWLPAMHEALGVFIPLIVTNCAVFGRAELVASRVRPSAALVDAAGVGVGFALVLMVLGGLRELLAHGTLLADAERLFGPTAAHWTIDVHGFGGLLLFALPPGGFLLLAGLAALRQMKP